MASITSADVAREAGLSWATVSYVLNNTPGQTIPERTRRRVLEAAERLGYVAHPGARALRLGRSDAVLFPLGEVSMTHVFGHAVNACSAALNRHGFTLVADATRYESPEAAANAWLRLGPAAFIDLTLTIDDPAVVRMVAAGIPRVAADLEVPPGLAAIDVVSLEARRLQFVHVAERGARRVVFAASPPLLTSRQVAPTGAATGFLGQGGRPRTRGRAGRADPRWRRSRGRPLDGERPPARCRVRRQ